MLGAIRMLGLLHRVGQAGVTSRFGWVETSEFGADVVLLHILKVYFSNVCSCFHFYLISGLNSSYNMGACYIIS